jgi:hypothetical protein
MMGASYRWTASFGIFLGGVTTVLMISALLSIRIRDDLLACIVWFCVSLLGVTVSLVSLFLHPDHPDRESPLNHRALGYVGVALNGWPWVLFLWFCWLSRLAFL